MASKIFVNLPVKDLQRSIRFFSQLGFRFDPKYTDDQAACLIVNGSIYAMLITEPLFRTFVPTAICDTAKANEVLLAISLDNRRAVDEMVANALAAGGTTYREPRDHGFMYEHGFRDRDGHLWELLHLTERQAEAVAG
jgi:predicted lactoylglutathione lyase